MRPIKLKIAGMNSFIQEEVIDFSKLINKGLFGIFGATGSGKSSILDAITMALYGKISRETTEFINTESNELYVYFAFAMGQNDSYQVERKLQKKESGGYLTTFCRLNYIDEQGTKKIYDKVGDINTTIEEIIGLNHKDFTRSVVLPQGKFSDFLTLKNTSRRNMLERILCLEEYGHKLVDKIKEERNKRNIKLNKLEGALAKYQDLTAELLNKEKTLLAEFKTKKISVKNKLDKLISLNEEYKEIWQNQQDLQKYELEKKKLTAKKEDIASKTLRLERGKKALSLKPYLTSYHKEQASKETQEKLKQELTAKKELLEKKIAKLKQEYETIHKLKEIEIPKLTLLKADITNAQEIKKAKMILVKEIKANQKEVQELLKKIEKLTNSKKQLTLEIKNKEKSLVQKEELISELKCSATMRQAIEQGRLLEEKYQLQEKSQQELLKEIKELKENIKKEENLIELEQAKKEKLETNVQEIKGKLQELEDNPAKSEKELFKQRELLEAKKRELKIYQENKEEFKEVNNRSTDLIKKEEKLKSSLQDINNQLQNKQEKLEKMEKGIKELKEYNMAAFLAKDLNKGEPCPVCGSLEHVQLAKKVETETELLEKEKQSKKLIKEIQKLEKNNHNLNSDLKVLENELQRQKELKKELAPKIASDDLKLQATIKKLTNEIKEETENLHNWQEKQEKLLKELKNKELLLNEIKLGEHLARLKKDQELLLKEKEKLANTESKFNKLEESYQEIKQETKINNFKKESIELSKKDSKREEIEKDIENLKSKLLKLQKQLDKQKEEINLADKQLQSLQQTIDNKLERQIEDEQKIKNLVGDKEPVSYLKEVEEKEKELIKQEKLKKENLETKNEELNKTKEELTIVNNSLTNIKKTIEETKEVLSIKIAEYKFESITEAEKYLKWESVLEKLADEINEYQEKKKELELNINRLKKLINGKSITKTEWEETKAEQISLETEHDKLIGQLASKGERIKNLTKSLEEKKELLKEKKGIVEELDLINDIYDLISANKFVEFVALRQLHYITQEASKRLMEITNNRYQLELNSKGEFLICDNYNGGVRRDCNTLSGGETFLSSLSLALALSSQIQLKGKGNLEFFFLDEGFGTLDSNLLDIVMTSLESLQTEKLAVGIISHVEELKNRVPIKLMVEAAEAGVCGSKVKIEYS